MIGFTRGRVLNPGALVFLPDPTTGTTTSLSGGGLVCGRSGLSLSGRGVIGAPSLLNVPTGHTGDVTVVTTGQSLVTAQY